MAVVLLVGVEVSLSLTYILKLILQGGVRSKEGLGEQRGSHTEGCCGCLVEFLTRRKSTLWGGMERGKGV